MLNKEKFAKEIIEIAITRENIGVINGKPCVCKSIACDDCDFHIVACAQELEKWANSEYKAIEIDWDRVPVDTPVLVWDNFETNKSKRYYAGLNGRYYMAFNCGSTSWSSDSDKEISSWLNCELVRKEDIQKYRKR